MKVQPYLMFEGRCEEAIEFYKKTLDAKVETMMRFRQSPSPPPPGSVPPGSEEKILHSALKIGSSQIMATDGHCTGHSDFQGFSLTLETASETEADRLFNGLAQGGKVTMPLSKTFFSPRFGMVTDKFGVGWIVMAARPA